jgi:3-oxoacyl-[acyl-carrier protein] reductase
MTPQRHNGRCVLVTGAASGIGASISRQYVQEGASVVLIDINADALALHAESLSGLNGRTVWFAADVADYSLCAKALDQALTKTGAEVDTLINNAGISPKNNGKPTSFWEMDPDEWHRVVGVNLHGAFNWSRLVTPAMVRNRFGSIVNMSSVAGKAFVPFTAAHYGTTKAALIGLTRDLAGELGPHGITVNAIAPGRIDTPLVRTASNETNRAVIRETALRRLGNPQEVAEMACFLTSPESGFVTGQVVDVAGGWLMT